MLSPVFDDPNAAQVITQREIGYQKAMQKAGAANHARVLCVAYDAQLRPQAIIELLKQRNRPRAIFCRSDLDAVHVIVAAKQLKRRVPQDLAIIDYDNSSVAALATVNLSSIDQSGKRLGSLTGERLLSRISGRTIASHILVEPALFQRQSH